MYDEIYGLTGRPFQLTPDPDFYFESGTHRKALSYLGYGLAQGEGFITITGEIGAGKSTLAAHLLRTIDRNRLTAAQIVTSQLDGAELIHVTARAFGIDVHAQDKASALAAIEAFLHDEARAGRRCLLVVDEAQALSIDALEELRMLSNLQLGAHPLLQILLLGQPEFRTLVESAPQLEQLRQRVIASHHLAAMEPGEVGPYIEYRLGRVGWKGDNPGFDQRVYTELARVTGGIPRRINQIVNRLMLMGAVEQRTRLDSPLLKAVLADLAADTAPVSDLPPPLPAAAPVKARSKGAPAAEAIAIAAMAPAIPPAPPPMAAAPSADAAAFEQALRVRDDQIAELQQAVIELADMRGGAAPGAPHEATVAALDAAKQQIAAMEARLAEQEATLRHVLTMLIEWFETEDHARAA